MFGSTVAHTQHCTEQKHKAPAKEWERPTAQRTFYAMLIHFEFGFGLSANTAANFTLHFFQNGFHTLISTREIDKIALVRRHHGWVNSRPVV